MDERSLANKIRDSLTNRYNAYSLDATNETYASLSWPVGMERPMSHEPGYEHNKPGTYTVSFYIRTGEDEGYEVSVKKIGLPEPDHNGR